jgi:hypothetical protein
MMNAQSFRFFLGVSVACATTVPASAAVCPVPSGAHPTIQSAVDDAGCTEVELVAQTFAESVVVQRDLALEGAAATTTVIAGVVTVHGGATLLELRGVTVDARDGSMAAALDVHGGARVSCRDVVVVNGTGQGLIFQDGFESGQTTAWSTTVP